jgi:hypothetical protein
MTIEHRRAGVHQLLYDDHLEQEKHMLDTIETLEAIGRDACLRHASTEELTTMLQQSHASEALKAAVMFGDSSRLSSELGLWPTLPPQSTLGIYDGSFDKEDAAT